MSHSLLQALRRRLAASRPGRWLRAFWRAPRGAKRLVAQMPVLIGVAWAALRVFSFRTVVRAVRRSGPGAATRPPATRRSAREIAWAVEAVGRRLLPERPCLPQALVALFVLHRHGHPATLRLGVKGAPSGAGPPPGGGAASVGAHAWVEDEEGRVLVGGLKDLHAYTPLPSWEDEAIS